MANLFDKQKFISGLRARGYNPTNEEIDSYIETMNLQRSAPKSYLPYKQQAFEQQPGDFPTLHDPYEPPPPPENMALDFIGNALWELMDVGTFGIVGALDYEDYLENLVTTGGPGTFAGRVGAGLGGLGGFLLPMAGVKAVTGAAVKGLSKFGTQAAAKKMVKQGADALKNTNYSKLSSTQQKSIWKPFTESLNQYGRPLENIATRDKFMKKLDAEIRPTIVKKLQAEGINPAANTITQIENVVRQNMGMQMKKTIVDGKEVLKWTGESLIQGPIWNLQQRIATQLGGSAGAGKIATIASHVIEEAAIFAAVETPMEIFNAIDEFRDPDIPGAIGHAVALGSVLGVIRFIPGGKDQPIFKTAFNRLNKMFNKKTSYKALDYGTEQARDILKKTTLSMYRNDPKLFDVALGKKGIDNLKGLGYNVDKITSDKMIGDIIDKHGQAGAEILADAMYQIEKNWTKRWWPEFWKESRRDLFESVPRMFAGAMAFNHSIVFDDNIPLEDKIFNIGIGAFMTKRGRQMDFIDANGKRTEWEITQRPWVYNNKIKEIDKHLRILGIDSPSLIFDSMLQENKLRNEIIGIDDTADMKAIMKVMKDHEVIISSEEKIVSRTKPEEAVDHELYDYLSALSGIYIHVNTGKRMKHVSELSPEKLRAIELDLTKLELTTKPSLNKLAPGAGLHTVADMQEIVYQANLDRTNQLLDLYRTVVRDMYATMGAGGQGAGLDLDKPVVARLNITNLADLSPEASKAVEKVQSVTNLLHRHRLISLAKSTKVDRSMKIDTTPEGQQAIVDRMAELENNLHQLVYGSSPVHPEYAVKVGDEFLANVINSNAIFKSVRDSHARLQALSASGEGSPAWAMTGRNDRARIDELIGDIFADPNNIGALYQRISLLEDQFATPPSDYQSIQKFANTLLEILPYTTKYGSPTGLSIQGEKGRASYTDVKELKNLFEENGMGGFAFSGEDLVHYVNEFKGYAIDQKIASSTRSDGTPLTGVDRAKLGALVKVGLVNENMELIEIVRQIDVWKGVVGNPEAWAKIQDHTKTHSGKGLVLTKKVIDQLFTDADINEKERIYQQGRMIQSKAAQMGGTLPELVVDLHSKYMEHLDPYIKKGDRGILSYRPGIEAEAPMVTFEELVGRLDLIDRKSMKESHRGLMNTLEEYSNKKGLTKEEQEFVTTLRNQFWNKTGDTAKVVSLLSRYGHTDDDGNFVSLYNRHTQTLDIKFKGAEARMKEALKAIEQHMPVLARKDLMDQKMRELTAEKLYESETSNSVSPQSFMDKYNIKLKDKDLFAEIMIKPNPADVLILAGAHIIDKKSGKKVFVKDMKQLDRDEFMTQVVRLSHTIGESRPIRRLTIGERVGVWADNDNTVMNNPLFRFLDDLVGPGNFSIVGRKVEMGIGTMDSRLDARALTELIASLYRGGATHDVNARAGRDGITLDTEAMAEHVFVGLGDYSWGLALPASKSQDIHDAFGKFIAKNKEVYGRGYGAIHKKLVDLYNLKSEEVTTLKELEDGKTKKVVKKMFKKSDAEGRYGESGYMETVVTMMWMDKMAGQLWWDHLAATTNKKTPMASAVVAKWSKRIRLMSNVSARELSDKHVKRVVSMYKKHNVLEKDPIADMKTLQKAKGLNMVLVTDEGKNAEIFDTLKGYLEQLNQENSATGKDLTRDDINKNKDGEYQIVDGMKKRKSASIADSVMIMPIKWFKALQAISGFHNLGKIGGMKPIISSTGDAILLGKTAIIPDTRFDGFFEKNKNVHAIMMSSAAKIVNDKILPLDVRNMTMDNLKNPTAKVGKENVINVPWKSINMGAAVADNHPATISYQLTNEMNADHSDMFYEWLIKGNVQNYNKTMGRFGNEKNPLGSTAFARTLTDPGTGDNEALSLMDMWINSANGGGPVQFTGVLPSFKNSVKKKFIDNGLLQLHNEHGSQSVMSPFLGTSWEELRNTTFHTDRTGRHIWTIGQAEIANVNINKSVALDRLNIIQHKKGDQDVIISYNDLLSNKAFIKAIKKVTEKKYGKKSDALIDGEKLGTVYEVLKEYNKDKNVTDTHEIAVVFHRTPSTRQSDKIVVGLKGFTKAEEGNQARLNPFDVFARAEADFDIDKINYWWDTPNDILKLWKDKSGQTPFVSEEPNPTTLKNNYDWLDVDSMRKLSSDVAHAEKMRGQVVKAQRLVQFVSQYHSSREQEGLVVNLSATWGNSVKNNHERIIFDPKKLDKNRHLLAEDIQRIIDSHNGYDAELYNNAWLDKFLFGDGGKRYDGLFKKIVYNEKERKWEDSGTKDNAAQPLLDEGEQAILREIISPYRTLLQLGTSIYEGGEARTPRYDDLVTGMRAYDDFMGDLDNRTYNRLKWKYKKQPAIMSRIDQIYGTDTPQYMKTRKLNRVTNDFGPNATVKWDGEQDAKGYRKLPFERMLATIAHGDKISQDSPHSLWGESLARFDNLYQQLMGGEGIGDSVQGVYNDMNIKLKDDLQKLRFVNYLKWKEGTQRQLAANQKKDGNTNMAQRITEDVLELVEKRLQLESQIVNSPEVLKEMTDVAKKRIINDILHDPQNAWREHGTPKFKDFAHANNWIKKNGTAIQKIASKYPIKYRAISSPEYRDTLIFHEILSRYENIFIDPMYENGTMFKEFNDDLRKFDRKRREMWSQFFGDKKRRDSFSPWHNETRIMNRLTSEFNALFDKWNDPDYMADGLGFLFLWKAMLPTPIRGEYTYYNGKLAPAFRERDMSMVKFGLRFLANADDSRISPVKKTMFFDLMTSQYSDWYDFLYSNKVTGKEGMSYRDMYDRQGSDLYDNPHPLSTLADAERAPTMQQDYNKILDNMFGVDYTYSYGFVMKDPSTAGAMKDRTQFHVFPRGYIPIHYKGGNHPRIQGWADWNRARTGEAYLMLGDSLNKQVLGFRETPIVKNTFNEVSSKPETFGDLHTTVSEKAQHEENGSTLC